MKTYVDARMSAEEEAAFIKAMEIIIERFSKHGIYPDMRPIVRVIN